MAVHRMSPLTVMVPAGSAWFTSCPWQVNRFSIRLKKHNSRKATEEDGIALRAKRLQFVYSNQIKLGWCNLPSKPGGLPIGRAAAKPGDFLCGPSRPSFFLHVKKSSAATVRTEPYALP